METKSKTYLKGSCKEDKFGNIRISLNKEQVASLGEVKGYVKVVLKKRKEIGKYGDTHYLELDTFVPNKEKKEYTDIPF